MRKFALAFVAALAMAGLGVPSNPAAAGQISRLNLPPPWTGGAFTNDRTGQFNGCIASVPYRSGITMVVAVDRKYGWDLGFGDQAWNLQPREQIPISMSFDGRPPWSGTATAINRHQVTIPMAPRSDLIAAFRGSYEMRAYASGNTYDFNLNGTSYVLAQLAQCVTNQLAAERGEPPPNVNEAQSRPLNAASSAPPAANPQMEVDAVRIASNLLLDAHLPNAHLLSPNETPPALRGHGVAWTSDAGWGAVELFSPTAAKDAQQVASDLIASDTAACKGDFASGRSSEVVNHKTVTKAFTGCKDSTGAHAFRYFIVRGAEQNFVVYEIAGSPAASAATDGAPLSDARFQTAAVKAAFPQ